MSDQELLEVVDNEGDGLTEWEIEFVDSLFGVLRKHKKLTAGQRMKLEQIYEDRCE